LQQLLFVAAKDAEGDTKENIKPINQENIPYSEKRLPNSQMPQCVPTYILTNLYWKAIREERQKPREANGWKVDAKGGQMRGKLRHGLLHVFKENEGTCTGR